MRSLIARLRHAAMFFAAGAVVAYFFDPDHGEERRRNVLAGLDELRSDDADPRFGATPAPATTPADGGQGVNDPAAPATPGQFGAALASR